MGCVQDCKWRNTVKMKKAICLIVLLVVVSATVFAQDTELPKLAVVEFNTNVNTEKIKADAITVRELVQSAMVKTQKYQVITRNEIDKLLSNEKIQASSISSPENIKKLQLQSISYIVTGSLNATDNDYTLTVTVLNVVNGNLLHSDYAFMGSTSREFINGVDTFMVKFIAGMETKEGKLVQTGKTYKIGDKGPGGGIIFYADDSVFKEVSPMLGSFNWENASKVATDYKGGGFTDWRLPSSSELNMIYENLRKKNIAALGDDYYWSSSMYGKDSSHYWFQKFSDGRQSNHFYTEESHRDKIYSVRAVRSF